MQKNMHIGHDQTHRGTHRLSQTKPPTHPINQTGCTHAGPSPVDEDVDENESLMAGAWGPWVTFPCYRWLSTEVDDARISRTLFVGHQSPLLTYKVCVCVCESLCVRLCISKSGWSVCV